MAQAKTKTVSMGPPQPAKGCEKAPKATACQIGAAGVDVNDFFPHGTSIHVGDKIKFVVAGFHTLDLPPKGDDPLPLIGPNGTTVSGVNDEAGSPFWFNDKVQQLGFNPALLQSNFGKKVKFNGKKRVLSGAPQGDTVKPITVTFKKAGKYTYFCNVHPGMTGVVKVKKKGRKVSSAKADKRAVKIMLKRSLKTAKKLPTTVPPSGNVDVGVAGKHGEEYFGFVPNNPTVKVGDTLTFRMSPGSREVHTASTGPGDPEADPNSYIGQLASTFSTGDPTKLDPRSTYPSEQPPSTAMLTPGLHGNGFWNTGVLDTTNATPLPESGAVTFGAPGTYQFYCLVHPFMHATVTVQ